MPTVCAASGVPPQEGTEGITPLFHNKKPTCPSVGECSLESVRESRALHKGHLAGPQERKVAASLHTAGYAWSTSSPRRVVAGGNTSKCSPSCPTMPLTHLLTGARVWLNTPR